MRVCDPAKDLVSRFFFAGAVEGCLVNSASIQYYLVAVLGNAALCAVVSFVLYEEIENAGDVERNT